MKKKNWLSLMLSVLLILSLLAGCGAPAANSDPAPEDPAPETQTPDTPDAPDPADSTGEDANGEEQAEPAQLEQPWADEVPDGEVVTTKGGESLTAYDAEMALFDECTFTNSDSTIGDMTYFVYDPTAHGFSADSTYPVVLWLHGGGNASLGRLAIAAGGAAGMASEKHQAELGGMYIICPLANEDTAGSWPTDDNGKYNASLKGIVDEVKVSHPAANDILLLAGTSAGGLGLNYFAEAYHDIVSGIFWMSTTIPSPETVKQYSDEGIKMWFEVSLHDETGAFTNSFPNGDTTPYDGIENFEYTAFEWVRWGDKSIASLDVGFEQGQHCSCAQVNRNLIFDDGTPDDPNHPNGVTGWGRSVIDGASA